APAALALAVARTSAGLSGFLADRASRWPSSTSAPPSPRPVNGRAPPPVRPPIPLPSPALPPQTAAPPGPRPTFQSASTEAWRCTSHTSHTPLVWVHAPASASAPPSP